MTCFPNSLVTRLKASWESSKGSAAPMRSTLDWSHPAETSHAVAVLRSKRWSAACFSPSFAVVVLPFWALRTRPEKQWVPAGRVKPLGIGEASGGTTNLFGSSLRCRSGSLALDHDAYVARFLEQACLGVSQWQAQYVQGCFQNPTVVVYLDIYHFWEVRDMIVRDGPRGLAQTPHFYPCFACWIMLHPVVILMFDKPINGISWSFTLPWLIIISSISTIGTFIMMCMVATDVSDATWWLVVQNYPLWHAKIPTCTPYLLGIGSWCWYLFLCYLGRLSTNIMHNQNCNSEVLHIHVPHI